MADHSKDFGVDLDKLRPLVERAIRDPGFAASLVQDAAGALAGVALTTNELRIMKGLTLAMIEAGKKDAASEAHEVEGQSEDRALARSASLALSRAWATTMAGNFVGGHWDPTTPGCGCCAWSSGGG